MEAGMVEYDELGNPICRICGKGFSRLLSHVSQKHGIPKEYYRTKFGYNRYTSLVSKRQKLISSMNALDNMDKIKANLEKGKDTRFKKGNRGRPSFLVSEQGKANIKEAAIKRRSNENKEE